MSEKEVVKSVKSEKEAHQKKEGSSKSPSTFVGTFALVIALASAVGVFVVWNNTMQSQKHTADLKPQVEHLQLAQTNLQHAIEQQAQTIKNLEETISKLREETGRNEDGWVLAEVDYIIRVANFNLELDRNVALAIKLLKTADDKIRQIGNPQLASLRMAIQKSIAKLSAITQVDTEGLVIRLQVLSKTIEALPLAKHTAEEVAKNNGDVAGSESVNWKETFKNSMKTLKEMVVIRRLDKPMKALMQPDQHANLIENIQLQLSMAQWAVLHHEGKIYEESLKLVKEWVGEFFQMGDEVSAVLKTIDELLAVNVNPQIPSVDVQVKDYANIDKKVNKNKQESVEPELPPLEPKQVEVLSS